MRYYQGNRSMPHAGKSVIRQLVLRGPAPAWLASSPHRQGYLIDALAVFEDREAASHIVELIQRKPYQPVVQMAALRFVRDLSIREAAPTIEEILGSRAMKSNVRSAALSTLAAVSPESKPLTDHLERLYSEKALTVSDLGSYIAVVNALLDGRSRDNREERFERGPLAAKILGSLLDQEFYLKWNDSGLLIAPSTSPLYRDSHRMPLDDILSTHFADAASKVFSSYISRSDIGSVHRFVSRLSVMHSSSNRWTCLPQLITFEGNLEMEDGVQVSFENAANGVWLIPTKERVVVHWVDLAGVARFGVLQSVSNSRYHHLYIALAPEYLHRLNRPR